MTQLNISDVMARLRGYIVERYKVPPSDPDFTDDVHLFDYGYIDSFGAVDLITFVKSDFQIELTENDLIAYPLNTIREIADFVIKRKAGLL